MFKKYLFNLKRSVLVIGVVTLLLILTQPTVFAVGGPVGTVHIYVVSERSQNPQQQPQNINYNIRMVSNDGQIDFTETDNMGNYSQSGTNEASFLDNETVTFEAIPSLESIIPMDPMNPVHPEDGPGWECQEAGGGGAIFARVPDGKIITLTLTSHTPRNVACSWSYGIPPQ